MKYFFTKNLSVANIIIVIFALATSAVLISSVGKIYSAGDQSAENAGKVMVLNYHKVDDMEISLSVTPADFEEQMRFLQDRGCHVITPNDLYDSLSSGKKLPDNPVIITFDDGYKDNYTNAYPILKKYNFKATIFVITDFVGRENYVTWADLKEMKENGISVESHTAGHNSLTDLTDDELRRELFDSRNKIIEELGGEVSFIAYPTGAYNLHIAQLVKDAGYKGAFTVKYGNVDANSNVFALERVPVFHTENTMKSFIERFNYTPLISSQGWLRK